jgi:hypothetical protein
MPRAVINVPIFQRAAPFDAVSLLLSHIAYPDSADERERENFFAALCRWAYIKTGSVHKNSTLIQEVRPYIFYPTHTDFISCLKRGTKLLWHHLTASWIILNPHLTALETGKAPPKVDGFEPTVTNLSAIIRASMGWDGDSDSTFKSKIWRPTKPIAHMAYTFVVNVVIPNLKTNPSPTNGSILEMLFPFPSNEKLLLMMIVAEKIRLELPEIRQFRITDESTLSFAPA